MTVRLVAPAKLTLSLRITGVRADGYHLIDAEMVSLDLCDELVVESFALGGASTTPVGGEVDDRWRGPGAGDGDPRAGRGSGPPDLVERALALAGVPARVRVTKRIPPGAGLGGGSSDAAAVLRWAGCRDLAGAARLGADVPFCLLGGRARVGGIGEDLRPLPFVGRAFTLLVPPFGCSTPAVYAAWDRLGGPVGDNGNDLEVAALTVEPRLAEWRDRLGEATGRVPRLAGSGATWFVPGAFPGGERLVVHTVPDRYAGRSVEPPWLPVGPAAWPLPGSSATFEHVGTLPQPGLDAIPL